ncbi:glutamyl-Q tRNA(Asp) synthetase [Rhizomicrobium palustre]|uniref:Glutamyl-Q tRNA(Asp) synthetase n=1 Tax=Rhizomicrobium palustre TaxID=189966 RepID=A0A846MYQ2_9PROT|nr:tRNA glutamyl-Q(34) synthetase GluQRS [Rhizomicrobium palustre]NIK88087.1 glutamyl-Q tRNA(Asp) synthetase [Rhizomicrobium palustre]
MITTRFAPSPTGLLHLGHAYAALFAAMRGARFLVRIEDIDFTRCKPEYEAGIFEDLAWLGLSWDMPVLRQSMRMGAYSAALERLKSLGLIYPCFCTRAEIAAEIARAAEAPHGPEGPHYPGTCRALSYAQQAEKIAAGIPYALRLDTAKAAALAGDLYFEESGEGVTGRIKAEPQRFGDIVLARKDTPAAYHLAVVVDDAFQGVNLVTRGEDLFTATHIQRLLQALLGLPEPLYAHHRLILDESGKKFSKRDRAVTLASLRESGADPLEIMTRIGFMGCRDIS